MKKRKRTIMMISVGIALLLIVPMYVINAYNHPFADDYYYGLSAAQTWQATHSLLMTIKDAWSQTIITYQQWQGSFSAIFLMRLQPAVFGDGMYRWAGIVLLTSFLLGSMMFYYVCAVKICRTEKWTGLMLGILVTLLSSQFLIKTSDSFYWYNGAIYYTFFYSLALLLISMVIAIVDCKNKWLKSIGCLIGMLLAFLIGGGNLITAFMTPLIGGCIALYFSVLSILRKRKSEVVKIFQTDLPFSNVELGTVDLLVFWLIIFAAVAGFAINALSPGYGVRQSTIGNPNGVLKSILLSFIYGGYGLFRHASSAVLMGFLLLIPFFDEMVQGLIKRGCSFAHPIWTLLVTFCFYSAQGTPLFYAEGIRMPYRIMNIIQLGYYIFVMINIIYVIGWLRVHKNKELPLKCKTMGYILVSMALVGMLGIGQIRIGEDAEGEVSVNNMPAGIGAIYSLATGEAKAYNEELNARIPILEDETITDAVVEPLSVKPEVLFHNDITENPGSKDNVLMSYYYQKTSIRLSE